MRNIDPKLKERLEKLYALAKSGEGGEKVNAQALLERLLAKHNMSIDMLIDIETKKYVFSYKTEFEKTLLFRIFSHVREEANLYYFRVQAQKKVALELTVYQYIELEIRREAYMESWKKYLKRDKAAFIVANGLTFYGGTEADEPKRDEDFAEIEKIVAMCAGVPDPEFRRNLLPGGAL